MARSCRPGLALALLAGLIPRAASAMTMQLGNGPPGTSSAAPVLLMQGAIVPGDLAKLRDALARTPAITTVVLNTPGGAVLEGRDMARLIYARRLGAIVPGNAVCASACFMLFAAARPKIAEPGARVGVHSASIAGGSETRDTLGTTTLMAREVTAYGVPASISGRMVTTKPGQMAWLSRAELESMGARVVAATGASIGPIVPGSAGDTPSDWTRGFEQGRRLGAGEACTPPPGTADAQDWSLGCASGRRSGASSVVKRARVPATGTPSDWSVGFAYGRAKGGDAVCEAPPPAVGNGADWSRGCRSGRGATAQ